MATNMLLIAGDPISLNLLAEGQQTDAAIAALARAVGFIPLVASTAIQRVCTDRWDLPSCSSSGCCCQTSG